MNKYRRLLQSATEEELIAIFDKHEYIQKAAEEEVINSEYGIMHDDLEFIYQKALEIFLDKPFEFVTAIELHGHLDNYRQYRESKIND